MVDYQYCYKLIKLIYYENKKITHVESPYLDAIFKCILSGHDHNEKWR